jgi:hypothetical protein
MQSGRICITVPALRRSVFAILVLVLGHLASWAHEGATRHVLCALHGEMVDAPQLARAVATGSWLVAVDAGGGGDEHCALEGGMRHDASPAFAHRATHVAIVTDVAIAAPMSRDSHLDFRIAPKTSPPVC